MGKARVKERQLTKREEVKALLTYPALYGLAGAVPTSGRPSAYPRDLLIAVAALARVYGSQNAALTELRGGLWPKVCKWYRAAVGSDVSLPSVPPTARVMDRLLQSLATPEASQELRTAFMNTSLQVATGFGLFTDGEPDYAHPDKHHLLLGDGTFYRTYSEVRRECVNPDEDEKVYRYFNTRAKVRPPRFQTKSTDASQDGKSSRGINHVTVSTKIGARSLVLAVDQSMGGEVNEALTLLAEVRRALGTRAHIVVWDRAISGKKIGHLLRDHGLLVINKDVARPGNKSGATKDDKSDATRLVSADKAREMYYKGMLPVGISVYPRTGGRAEVVLSKHVEFGPVPGTDCWHDLHVDDGGLWDTIQIPDVPGLFKFRQVKPITSRRLNRGTAWALETRWRLECGSHGRCHEFTTVWDPLEEAPQRKHDKAIAALRPVPRSLERFAEVHGDRNSTESLHAWFKARTGTTANRGRATRLDGDAQLIEHLWACLLRNAISYYRITRQI
ncbi:hypothetical protein Q6348_08365 [Isoptericola sp. b441]|uniref:Transposase n=1 Tax=Actinotalea lenta TaxID=3064654 RepID=A0ABT9D8J3_9CELL|nr:hypothetical protein [Isoptericola sp. b441]MDO8107207.1 hypothetical protein [Isoptericola sp. b441]